MFFKILRVFKNCTYFFFSFSTKKNSTLAPQPHLRHGIHVVAVSNKKFNASDRKI